MKLHPAQKNVFIKHTAVKISILVLGCVFVNLLLPSYVAINKTGNVRKGLVRVTIVLVECYVTTRRLREICLQLSVLKLMNLRTPEYEIWYAYRAVSTPRFVSDTV